MCLIVGKESSKLYYPIIGLVQCSLLFYSWKVWYSSLYYHSKKYNYPAVCSGINTLKYWKFRKHDFEIAVDSKVPTSRPTFVWVPKLHFYLLLCFALAWPTKYDQVSTCTMLVDLWYYEDKYRKAMVNTEQIRKKIIAMKEDDGPVTSKQIERKAGFWNEIEHGQLDNWSDQCMYQRQWNISEVTRPGYLPAR